MSYFSNKNMNIIQLNLTQICGWITLNFIKTRYLQKPQNNAKIKMNNNNGKKKK